MENSKKIKLLIIAAHRPGRSPSQRFRFEQYISHFEESGIEVKLSYIINERDDLIFYSPGKIFSKLGILLKAYSIRLKDVLKAKRYDVVLIQREAIMTRTTLFEKLLSKRRPVIFDFDDAIWKMDVSDANEKLKWLKNPAKTSAIIKKSNYVIAGNSYLAAYAKKFNEKVIVIPTTVDTDLFSPSEKPKNENKIIIGWSGSKTTIKHFELAIPVLKRIKQKYGDKVGFVVIGANNYKNEDLDISGIIWSPQTEVSELRKIDIGIMPLPNDEWSKGKCGLKGLTYMSLQIPTVMGAVGVNAEIIEHGENGFLYSNDEEFYDALVKLIDDKELRLNMGNKGRHTVMDRYSVHANKEHYINLILSLANKKGS